MQLSISYLPTRHTQAGDFFTHVDERKITGEKTDAVYLKGDASFWGDAFVHPGHNELLDLCPSSAALPLRSNKGRVIGQIGADGFRNAGINLPFKLLEHGPDRSRSW